MTLAEQLRKAFINHYDENDGFSPDIADALVKCVEKLDQAVKETRATDGTFPYETWEESKQALSDLAEVLKDG